VSDSTEDPSNVIALHVLTDDDPFSPSHIKSYAACPRKWGWDKLEQVPRKENLPAEFGTRCHTILENWLGKGIPPDPSTKEGKVVIPGLKFLPKPNPSLDLERYITFSANGNKYHGYVDLGL
jgi:hypothetical protein